MMLLTVLMIVFLILWIISALPASPGAPYTRWAAIVWAVCVTLRLVWHG